MTAVKGGDQRNEDADGRGGRDDGAVASDDGSGASRPRGRPPRLSREGIIAAVLESLRSDPTGPLTISRFAEAAGAAPMAIYRHFSDRDDLLTAVGNEILLRTDLGGVVPHDPWQARIRAWMTAIHDQFAAFPQVSRLLTTELTGAPGWVQITDRLIQALGPEGAGLHDQDLADAMYWVGSSTIFHVHGVIHSYKNDYMGPTGDRFEEEIARHGPEVREHWTLIDYTINTMDRAFDIVIERTIAAVEDLVRHPTSSRARRGGADAPIALDERRSLPG